MQESALPNETYEAIYVIVAIFFSFMLLMLFLQVSPTNSHPPLQLRLTAPQEPGFILRKIRVQSLRQIWSIFEVSAEYLRLCWFKGLWR